jgi:hypothetical protein
VNIMLATSQAESLTVAQWLAQWIGLIKYVLLSIGAVVGIYVALRGLTAWQRQLTGNVEYDLARRLMKAAYKYINAMNNIRNSVQGATEIQEALEEYGSKEENLASGEGTRAVYMRRWNQFTEVGSALDVEALEAKVIWGDIVKDKLDAFRSCTLEMHTAIQRYVAEGGPKLQRTDLEKKLWRDTLNILMPGGDLDGPDTFAKKLQDAVSGIETLTRKHLVR